MKKIVFTLVISGLVLGGVGGGCGLSAVRVGSEILNSQFSILNWDYRIFRWCAGGVPGVERLPELLDGKTYVILLQNNNELRPSGGFMGSYAVLRTQDRGLKDVKIEDIYVPDGQLVGHVDPPVPIQQAFGQGWWKLRDSNWDVDFRVAGEQIAWFFEQGGEKVDGMAAVNLSLVNKWLEVLGEVKTEGYGEGVTAKNLAGLAQKYAEAGFFPGSTQKRDFLGAVGGALWERTKRINPIDLIKLINLIYQELQKGQVLVWVRDKEMEKEILEKGWGGGLENYGGDYLYIVESNLGANKANCCVSREVTQEIDDRKERLEIRYENDNPFANPKPPVFWGGNYVNYLRIVVPKAAEIQRVNVAEKELQRVDQMKFQYGLQEDVYTVEDRGGFKTVGFWAVVPAQKSTNVEVEYSLLRQAQDRFTILVKRQPGMESFGYKLVVEGKVAVSDTIDRDKEYTWTK